MNELTEPTRILFEGFQLQTIYLFYAFGYSAIAVFIYGCYVQIRKYRRGQPDPSWGNFLKRFGSMVVTMLTHRTLKRRDPVAGKAHALIFFGFILLFIGTIGRAHV